MNKINRFLPSYFLVIYIIFILTTALFTLRISSWSIATVLIITPSLLFYPFLQLLPALALSQAAGWSLCKAPRAQLAVTGTVTVLAVYIVHLFLLLDAGLYFRYGYHVNPHVLNIFTTPGGFEGMGMRPNEIAMLGAGIALLAALHAGIFILFAKVEKLSFRKISSWKPFAVTVPVLALTFVIPYFTYTYSHYTMNSHPLLAADAIPLYIKGTSGSLYKSLGVKKPTREAMMIKISRNSTLQAYPAKPVTRTKERKKYNVLWLACESWAARLFTPEIMPNTAKFAEKGILFKNHYSGGNVTRQGVFSMFYGLPGNYWHAFLAARRSPLFIDWLKEDGYTFKCLTSSKFTYPEFDQTVFFAVKSEDMHSDAEGLSFERDQRNVKKLISSLEASAKSENPAFNFMFFESCHHPYSFPEEATLYKDYINPFNAVNATAANGEAIFKRAANAAHHLDMRLGEVFNALEKNGLLENTIVVVAGDHGEEFFEKGRLGHSSTFNNEQTRTTLIIYYPGVKPQVYTKMSSHLDIVPMLAGFFGVQNPAEDYSCGINLLAENAPERKYALIANWDEVFFAGEKYKSHIPMDADDFAKQTITDADDRELDDVGLFYKEYSKELIKVQKDLTRFTAPVKK
ncbi:MAG: DUF3413 domain-containing protein [Lentisphaerae bacterium]|nr:DUF3413 domain-containing protein [Lentisphaerota bacterium]